MSMAETRAELLAPAGDAERLTMALRYGADAVYLAGEQFGMRAAAGNFTADALARAVETAHSLGRRIYVTCNTVMRNDEAARLPGFFETLESAGADAAIVADLGALALCKKYAPHVKIHASTQAGVANFESARAFHDLGAARVVLARELTLSEIAELRGKTPRALELEVFVHGSMCVSFSGRCLISNYLTGRDANRGECAQPCRWKYHLVEERRPGQYLEISEDGGTHIMNSRDLCMIDHIPALLDAGVDSLKIEGRMKSFYYTAVITNAYRHALDAALRGEPLADVWRNEVNMVSHREYSTGFFFDASGPGQYYKDAVYFSDCDVAAVVDTCGADCFARLIQRNKLCTGDRLQLLTPTDAPVSFICGPLFDDEGAEIPAAPHPMMPFRMRLPVPAPPLSLIRKMR